MYLLQVSDQIDHIVKTSEAISQHGILVVMSATMIVFFMIMTFIVFRSMKSNNEKIIAQNDTIKSQNETITNILSDIVKKESYEALIEQTRQNTEKLLKISFEANLLVLLKGASDILVNNHIADKEYTERRIRSLVNTSHFDRVKWLNSFRYKSTRLGDIADTENWIEKKTDIIRRFIYSEDKNRDQLVRELSLAYKEFNNEITF